MNIKILQEFMEKFNYRHDLDKRFSTLKAFKKLKNSSIDLDKSL